MSEERNIQREVRPDADRELIVVEDQTQPAQVITEDRLPMEPELAAAIMERRVELLNKLTPAAIRVTRPQDWVVMGSRLYLQGTGADRLAPIWGISYGGLQVHREDFADGSFAYVVSGWVESKLLGIRLEIQGGRSSKDSFFANQRNGVDPVDVRKAALTNWKVRAICSITGLHNLTPEDVQDAGFDISRIPRIEYQTKQDGTRSQGTTQEKTSAADAKTKLWQRLLKVAGGDKSLACKLLERVSEFQTKSGKLRSVNDISQMSDRWAQSTWGRVKDMPDEELMALVKGGEDDGDDLPF
jgi:hypothetical protein